MSTTTLLGILQTETSTEFDQADEARDRIISLARPQGRVLRNDGIQRYWLHRGAIYHLAHDGIGWRVTTDAWTDRSHTYRLAEPLDAHLADTLTTTDGEHQLQPDTLYQIHERAAFGPWELHVVHA